MLGLIKNMKLSSFPVLSRGEGSDGSGAEGEVGSSREEIELSKELAEC